MNQQDTITVRNWTIAIMLGVALVVLFIVLGLLKNYLWPHVDEAAEFRYERIKPIGQVNVGQVDVAAQTATEETATTPKSGKEIYDTVCTACHSTGVLNAPKYGDKASWTERVAKGEATLVQQAINGFNAMPARGGQANLTDEEVKLTVQYMLEAVGANSSSSSDEAENVNAPETTQGEEAAPESNASETTQGEEAAPESNASETPQGEEATPESDKESATSSDTSERVTPTNSSVAQQERSINDIATTDQTIPDRLTTQEEKQLIAESKSVNLAEANTSPKKKLTDLTTSRAVHEETVKIAEETTSITREKPVVNTTQAVVMVGEVSQFAHTSPKTSSEATAHLKPKQIALEIEPFDLLLAIHSLKTCIKKS